MYYSYNFVYEHDPVAPRGRTSRHADRTRSELRQQRLLYDPIDANSIAFGGRAGGARWEYVGADRVFTNLSAPLAGPIQRQDPAHRLRQQGGQLIMLFGGYKAVDANPYKQDTWQWSGTDQNWTPKTNANAKPRSARLARWPTTANATSHPVRRLAARRTSTTSGPGRRRRPTWRGRSDPGRAARGHVQQPNVLRCRARQGDLVENYYTIRELDPTDAVWTQRSPLPAPAMVPTSSPRSADTTRSRSTRTGASSCSSAAMATTLRGSVHYDTLLGVGHDDRPLRSGPRPWAFAASRSRYATASPTTPPAASSCCSAGQQVTGMVGDSSTIRGSGTGSPGWTEDDAPGASGPCRASTTPDLRLRARADVLFGGSVPADGTYGPQEILAVLASTAPRPNGSGCSAASAASARRASASTACVARFHPVPDTCKACNVPGPPSGTCSYVPADSATIRAGATRRATPTTCARRASARAARSPTARAATAPTASAATATATAPARPAT